MADSNPQRIVVPGTTLEVAEQENAPEADVVQGTPPAATQQDAPIDVSLPQQMESVAERLPEHSAEPNAHQSAPTPVGQGYQQHNFGPSFASVSPNPAPMQAMQGSVNGMQGCELCQQPKLAVQPECSQCGDWGCSSCRFKSHGGFSINKLLYGNAEPTVSIGGWLQGGIHTASNDLFNDRPDELNFHQGWLYAEKRATGESPLGFRADIMYGIDGADTQAFGNDTGEWDFDNGFDFGPQSWAIPQLYGEIAIKDWTIKAGHFFTLVGYEVVTAPDNFFYSHAITMYNTEPFTHTGVLASRSIADNLEIYAGWTLGWDTGFDQFDGGSSWLGGFSFTPMEELSFTYISTAGNLGARGDDAYSHSMVLDLSITNSLNYIVQSDVLRVAGTGEDNFGINQYLLYHVDDKLGVGARVEWWKGDVLTGYAPHGGVLPANGSLSYYAATVGLNYRPTSNLIARPEVRYDWSPASDYDEVYLGIDAIVSF